MYSYRKLRNLNDCSAAIHRADSEPQVDLAQALLVESAHFLRPMHAALNISLSLSSLPVRVAAQPTLCSDFVYRIFVSRLSTCHTSCGRDWGQTTLTQNTENTIAAPKWNILGIVQHYTVATGTRREQQQNRRSSPCFERHSD